MKTDKSKLDAQQEQLDIPDVSHSLYGKLNIGDDIKWWGKYYDGYDENNNMKTKHQEGINKIVDFLIQSGVLFMRLDNRKLFIIRDVETGEEPNIEWEKL